MPSDLELVVLDVNETLSDMAPIADVFERLGASRELAPRWFATVLGYGFTSTMSGTPHTFAEIAVAMLPALLGRDDAGDTVLDAFGSLSLHPDVADGLRAMRDDGLRIVTFTNGAAANTRRLLERGGVLDVVEATLSVEDAGAWKPDPRSYTYAVERCGVAPEQAVMVAVHPWDLHGAHQIGMRTAWVNRNGAPYPSINDQPDYAAESMTALAALLH